jgi:hypothetical protein
MIPRNARNARLSPYQVIVARPYWNDQLMCEVKTGSAKEGVAERCMFTSWPDHLWRAGN